MFVCPDCMEKYKLQLVDASPDDYQACGLCGNLEGDWSPKHVGFSNELTDLLAANLTMSPPSLREYLEKRSLTAPEPSWEPSERVANQGCLVFLLLGGGLIYTAFQTIIGT